jgi:hypothetical protein
MAYPHRTPHKWDIENLTEGKVYIVYNITEKGFLLFNDSEYFHTYPRSVFRPYTPVDEFDDELKGLINGK